ncbi:unnamed protein product [Peniophora sp. CBMAI 1063]|nr:unnamed protein product [Peniophora sp. CBMAI 1063]
MSRFWSLFHVGTPFDPYHRFETSATFSPYVLGSLRALIALYGVLTIIVSMSIRSDPSPAQSFSYFSNITWWGITFYHIFASFHTLSYARTGRAPLDSWPRTLQLLHSLLFSTVVTYPLMVTVVFWGLQFGPDKFDTAVNTWSNISHHALNTAFALFEITFSRTERPPLIHVIPIALMLGGYACIAYITHATEGFYTYGFLDPTKHTHGVLAGIIVGMGALGVAMFVVSWCAIWARLWVVEVRMGLAGRFSERDMRRIGVESGESAGGFVEKEEGREERIEMVDKGDVQTRVDMV